MTVYFHVFCNPAVKLIVAVGENLISHPLAFGFRT